LIDVFLDESLILLDELEQALAIRDGARLSRSAHSLKECFGHFGATSASRAASQLEKLGKFVECELVMDDLLRQADELRSCLVEYRNACLASISSLTR
jgi:HPt (histidine-containing phosphotransfer) domain-containing protein